MRSQFGNGLFQGMLTAEAVLIAVPERRLELAVVASVELPGEDHQQCFGRERELPKGR